MRLVLLLALGTFALGLDAYVTAGLLSAMADDLGTSVSATGQTVTAFTLAYALVSPLCATLLSAARQRTGLLVSLAVFALANAGSALAPSFAALLVTRAVAGVGAGLYLALAASCATTLVSAERRGRALAMIMGGMSSGTVLGVPVGVLLARHAGWRATLCLVAVLGVLSLAGLAVRLPRLLGDTASSPSLRDRLAVLADGRVASVVTVSFLAAVGSLGLYTYLAPVMESREMGGVHGITPYLWAWGVGGVLGSVLIGPLVDRFRRPYALVVGVMAVLCCALAAFRVTASVTPLLALLPLAVWGAAGWALQVPQQHELTTARGTGGGTVAVALNESALYLGSAVGSGLGGLAFGLGWDASVLPLCAAGFALLGLLTQLTWVRTATRRARPTLAAQD
ncbi:MFS transporter [Streptomyces albiaxialis]|uniref:MFS transporter n=1 Tax=Streptomyces albiaxialis TaxID=329523 RepID=A0ABN2WCI1_9ACTN